MSSGDLLLVSSSLLIVCFLLAFFWFIVLGFNLTIFRLPYYSRLLLIWFIRSIFILLSLSIFFLWDAYIIIFVQNSFSRIGSNYLNRVSYCHNSNYYCWLICLLEWSFLYSHVFYSKPISSAIFWYCWPKHLNLMACDCYYG